jgi:hypothetical protein
MDKALGQLSDASHESAHQDPAASEIIMRPAAVASISREKQICAVLDAPVTGSIALAYTRMEATLRAEFAALTAAECRALAARLRRSDSPDTLAVQFRRMSIDRRDRLLAYLDGARRREALRGVATPPFTAAPAAALVSSVGFSTGDHMNAPHEDFPQLLIPSVGGESETPTAQRACHETSVTSANDGDLTCNINESTQP